MPVQTILKDEDRQRLREQGGAWLRKQREAAGLSQRELALAVDVRYYTFISQIEAGRGRIPSERFGDWAAALGMHPKEFVRRAMFYYEPAMHAILFGDE